MSDISDAQPDDIYVDANGKLWRVIAFCSQPTITVEEVEGRLQPQLIKNRKSGGIGGLMWEGFKRIWRQE